ncbi:MAG TPA: lytic transglycosylase domain-containing protein [Gaiellaceae bacterium]|jgi:soluble lytic murein transglycosylase
MRRVAITFAVLFAAFVAVAAYVIESSPPWYERLRYPLHYDAIVRERAHAEHLDPALLAAVIYQESKFRPTATSSSGAIGLMQLTPSTAQGIATRTGGTAFHVSDLTDPALNIRYGTWYLHDLFAKYGSVGLVLAAYNAGQGNVDRWQKAGEGIQFPETRAYVSRVEHLERVYRDAWHAKLYS